MSAATPYTSAELEAAAAAIGSAQNANDDEPERFEAYNLATAALTAAHQVRAAAEQPAPELAAAMAESRRYREALEQVAGHHDSRVGVVRVIAKIAKRALEAK